MKAFRVTIFNPRDTSEIYEGTIIEAKSEILLREIVKMKGFEIKGEAHEVEIEGGVSDKIRDWFAKNFSTSTFNAENEVTILGAFADSLRRGFTEQEALKHAKFAFGKSQTAIRGQIDKLVETYEGSGIEHISDVFVQNSEMFSDNFISLMQESKGAAIKIDKIISNPVSKEEKGKKVEGYVELTVSVNHLLGELKSKISKPIFWFMGMFSVIMAILVFLIPNMLKSFAKIRDISKDSYYGIGEVTIGVSNFVSNYGIYALVFVFSAFGIIVFLYQNNDSIKEAIHKYLANMFIVGDIINLVYTKKITSLMAIYHESGMQWEKIFEIVIPLTRLIPMKKELEYLKERIKSHDFEKIFTEYPDDEKYFTEIFYVQLAKESNSHSAMSGRFGIAFATILNNTDELWERSIKHYPDKIGTVIRAVGFALVGFFTLGIMMIFILTIVNSV